MSGKFYLMKLGDPFITGKPLHFKIRIPILLTGACTFFLPPLSSQNNKTAFEAESCLLLVFR